ncbi:hypothetical protein MHH81_21140 [Psychrobacillus sp. FSL H8-0484]
MKKEKKLPTVREVIERNKKKREKEMKKIYKEVDDFKKKIREI